MVDTDCPALTEVIPSSGGGTTGVIPLSVEMLSDSDDEDDDKPRLGTSTQSAAPAAGSLNGKSKLLLLKMASEYVEAVASRQPTNHGTLIIRH